jgi:threonine dehydrogenase-like Zn-dependent dehydrogenase
MFMKAAIIEKPEKLVLREIPPLPPIGDYQCYCRNLFASACTGTDRKIIHNKLPWGSNYPAVLGHETVGEIIETGSKVKNFKVGDIVLRPVYVYAGQKLNGFGSEFGGFSEIGMISDKAAMLADGMGQDSVSPYADFQMKIPGNWKNRPESVLLITMKETFSWIKELGPFYGKKVGVIGTGAVGIFYIKFASLMFAESVTAIARTVAGRKRAEACGADKFIALEKQTEPAEKFDVLIDAAGVSTQIDKYSGWLKPGGTFAFYGVDSSMEISLTAFGSGLNFAFHSPAEADPLIHHTCIAMVDKGIIDLKQFHSSVMSFDKIVEAFEMIEKKEEFKPVFEFNEKNNK